MTEALGLDLPRVIELSKMSHAELEEATKCT
jgi:hypothetical protein